MTDKELVIYLRRSAVSRSHPFWKAADRIELLATTCEQLAATNEALVKERDKAALWATEQHACADNYALRLGQEKARAERLEAAADYILDGMGIDAPDYEIDPDDDFLDAANSDWVRDVLTRLAAALKGADHE